MGAGHQSCVCLLCEQLIGEDDMLIRAFDTDKDLEARFHINRIWLDQISTSYGTQPMSKLLNLVPFEIIPHVESKPVFSSFHYMESALLHLPPYQVSHTFGPLAWQEQHVR